MKSKDRILAAINKAEVDHVPIYFPCFGFSPPEYLRWKREGKDVKYWYTMRLEHIHTLPQRWDLQDDFERVKAWRSLGVDDILDVSFPWDIHPEVKIKDWREGDLLCRVYETPEGEVIQKVRKTSEEIPPGWVIQPDKPALFEDFNLPRSVKFPLSEKEDVPKLRYLLQRPRKEKIEEYRERMAAIKDFSSKNGVFVQGWPIFGMDGVVWLMGIERAVIAAMTEPDFFQEVVDLVYEFDLMRMEMMLEIGGVDMVVQRGWYSSTDFWSPKLFREWVFPNLKKLVKIAHEKGVKFGYVMTTGVNMLIQDLIEAGVDLLYFVDPQGDDINLEEFKERVKGKITVCGGISTSLVLNRADRKRVKEEVKKVLGIMGKEGFILSCVDALFPDTPWESVEAMLDAWRKWG